MAYRSQLSLPGIRASSEDLDQLNLGPLPRILSGVGTAPVSLLFDAVAANIVDITIGEGTAPPRGPSLTSVTPSEATTGETVSIMLVGEGLAEVTGVEVISPGDVTVGAFQAAANSVSTELTLAASAVPGVRMIRVTTVAAASNSVSFTINAAQGLTISNLTFDATATTASNTNVLIFSGGFDFIAPKGNVIFTGNLLTSARIEQVILSNTTAQRCTFLLSGSLLNSPIKREVRFDRNNPSFRTGRHRTRHGQHADYVGHA